MLETLQAISGTIAIIYAIVIIIVRLPEFDKNIPFGGEG